MNNSSSSNSIISVMGCDDELIVMFEDGPEDYSNDSKEFISDIPKLFKNVKGVLFHVFDHKPIGYNTNMDFCDAIKAKMDMLKVPYYFEPLTKSAPSILLVAANATLKSQDLVYIIFAHNDSVVVTEYENTKDGFKEIGVRDVPIDLKENPKAVRDKILGTANLKKIILTTKEDNGCKSMMKFLRIALKSKKLIVFENTEDMRENYAKEMAKWFMDKSYTKYYILPTCARPYFFVAVQGKSFVPIFSLDRLEPLPYKKCFRLYNPEKIGYGDASDTTSVRTINLNKKCHHYEVTVNIDINNFIDVKYEAIIFDEIKSLPKNLDEKFDKNIPVIGILGEYSVICIQKNGGYQFLDAWNSLYGKELIISFEEEKPKFCDNVVQNHKKRNFVVYDLMKIMSMSADGIVPNTLWPFTITKDATNPVLLEFDNFDGTKKVAAPAFLMAMLIKHHLKAIKKETGIKPTEIGFSLLQKFSQDERKRVEEQLEESCKLLEIVCVFVNV